MNPTAKIFLTLGALAGLIGVAFGAFGAHALKAKLSPELMVTWQTALQHQFWHALGLLLVGVLVFHWPASDLLKWSGWLMLAGIVLFSGSLYLLALTGARWLGPITPIGGLAWIAAWAVLAVGVMRA